MAVADWASQRLSYDDWERVASVSTDFATGTDAADTFGYDNAGRIGSWTRSGFGEGDGAYGFDVAGNLTSKTRDGIATSYSYNAGNQLTTETVASIETTHGYDEFGRLVRSASPSSVTTYTWDPLGHLAQVASDEATASYEYGISGMREQKTVVSAEGTRTVKSVWAGMQLVAELDSDGTRYEYIYGGGIPLELVVTSGGTTERFAYQVDAGGSVIGITDEDGVEVARYAYDPYGVPTTLPTPGSLADRNPLRYRGYYFDAETGMYYLPARYYEPESARFLSVDPAPPKTGDPVSINRYSYCFGDPIGQTDSTGAVIDDEANSWARNLQAYGGDRKAAHFATYRDRFVARNGKAQGQTAKVKEWLIAQRPKKFRVNVGGSYGLSMSVIFNIVDFDDTSWDSLDSGASISEWRDKYDSATVDKPTMHPVGRPRVAVGFGPGVDAHWTAGEGWQDMDVQGSVCFGVAIGGSASHSVLTKEQGQERGLCTGVGAGVSAVF